MSNYHHRRAALEKWKNRNGNAATYKALIDLFINTGYKEYADKTVGKFEPKVTVLLE